MGTPDTTPLALALLCMLLGCSEERGVVSAAGSVGLAGSPATENGANAAGSDVVAGSSAGGVNAPSCEAPGQPSPPRPVALERVTVGLVDRTGAPVPGTAVQFCGVDVCLRAESDAGGRVERAYDPPIAIDRPALKLGDGLGSAEFALAIPGAIVDLGVQPIVLLPPLGEGDALAPGASARSGDVALALAPGTQLDFDGLRYPEGAARAFRATRLLANEVPGAVDPALGLGIVIATAPIDTTFCPPATLSVANVPRWAPGALVDVLLHGTDIAETYAPYAGWAQLTEAQVSDDGASIVTLPPGIPVLGPLGFRLRR